MTFKRHALTINSDTLFIYTHIHINTIYNICLIINNNYVAKISWTRTQNLFFFKLNEARYHEDSVLSKLIKKTKSLMMQCRSSVCFNTLSACIHTHTHIRVCDIYMYVISISFFNLFSIYCFSLLIKFIIGNLWI